MIAVVKGFNGLKKLFSLSKNQVLDGLFVNFVSPLPHFQFLFPPVSTSTNAVVVAEVLGKRHATAAPASTRRAATRASAQAAL